MVRIDKNHVILFILSKKVLQKTANLSVDCFQMVINYTWKASKANKKYMKHNIQYGYCISYLTL